MQYVQQHGNDDDYAFSVAVANMYCKVQEELLGAIEDLESKRIESGEVMQLLESSLPIMCALLGQ